MFEHIFRSSLSTIVLTGLVLLFASSSLPQHGEHISSPAGIVSDGTIPTSSDVYREAEAARIVVERNAPNGVITIFGSARATEGMVSYEQTREFARKWSIAYGHAFPIMTGGSIGIMEAGNRGAMKFTSL